jgi:hypothetical protein
VLGRLGPHHVTRHHVQNHLPLRPARRRETRRRLWSEPSPRASSDHHPRIRRSGREEHVRNHVYTQVIRKAARLRTIPGGILSAHYSCSDDPQCILATGRQS